MLCNENIFYNNTCNFLEKIQLPFTKSAAEEICKSKNATYEEGGAKQIKSITNNCYSLLLGFFDVCCLFKLDKSMLCQSFC